MVLSPDILGADMAVFQQVYHRYLFGLLASHNYRVLKVKKLMN